MFTLVRQIYQPKTGCCYAAPENMTHLKSPQPHMMFLITLQQKLAEGRDSY